MGQCEMAQSLPVERCVVSSFVDSRDSNCRWSEAVLTRSDTVN